MVNASTWALMLTGRVLDDDPKGPARALRGLVKRLGEPVVRTAVGQSMKILGRQFVLGQTIDEGMKNARELEKKGYTYSYDMLGEAARTDEDAQRYHKPPMPRRSRRSPSRPRAMCDPAPASRSSCRRCIRATNTRIATRS